MQNLIIRIQFKYIDLARAKSEPLYNIYSLLKQNIKSCNDKRRRQRRRTVKNNNREYSDRNIQFVIRTTKLC